MHDSRFTQLARASINSINFSSIRYTTTEREEVEIPIVFLKLIVIMELPQLCNIQALVKEIKGGMFSNIDYPNSFVSPSAYDTAWLAMIPDSEQPFSRPMFENCLNWVLNNQREDGSWGELDGHGNNTIESLPATLACIIVLKRWNSGNPHQIQNGGLTERHSFLSCVPLARSIK